MNIESLNTYSKSTFDRVNVVGASGSGKSTFSKNLAVLLGHPRIEMDALFWEPNWTQPTDEIFFARLSKALEESQWVLDGNYDRTLAIKWAKVTAVVWIDYSFPRTLIQAVRRAIRRVITQEELWANTGNKETLRKTFLSRDSILLWTIKTHKSFKPRYTGRMNDPDYQHIAFFRVKNPGEARVLLETIKKVCSK